VFLCAAPSLGVAFTLKTLIMPGKVIEAHAAVEENCASCHEDAAAETQEELCLACHVDVRTDVLAGVGFHGRHPDVRGARCYTCHDEHEGRNADIVRLDVDTFAHVHTDFPLLGRHERVGCAGCHEVGAEFRDAPRTCFGCHAADDAHGGALAQTCEGCHNATAWRSTSFDHSRVFALAGKHAATPCAGCHESTSFTSAPTQCAACHGADDVHRGRNGAQCDGCHSPVAWRATTFDHAALTSFALRGSHQRLRCESCHVENLAASVPSTCQGCHRNDDAHGGALGSQCGDCHTAAEWSETGFDHSRATGFVLAGAHANLACTSCHTAGAQAALGRACASCHRDDPHRGQVGARCESCHSQTAWQAPLRFDHGLIAFPLLGKHAQLECANCHASLAFHDAGTSCADCHSAQDVHGGAFGATCSTCHNPRDWRASSFDHGARTGFALTGAHERASCSTCHSGRPVPAAGAQACGQCHRADDPHGGRFGADCASCHGTDSFREIRRR
jgi:hypothetical protein